MIDAKICAWLIDNADAPIRYRVARELLRDENAARRYECALLEDARVRKWLNHLDPQSQPLRGSALHGSFDHNFENAMSAALRLGLHCGIAPLRRAAEHYADALRQTSAERPFRNSGTGFGNILTANLLAAAGLSDSAVTGFLLGSLDEMSGFIRTFGYDIYLDDGERAALTGVPKVWREGRRFIKPEISREHGFPFPLIYDALGLSALFALENAEVNAKIDAVAAYFLCDEFHEKIEDGYGILVAGRYASGGARYNSMGWSPHVPGWFGIVECLDSAAAPRLLFVAESIARLPSARGTGWFAKLNAHLEKYSTGRCTYVFPVNWLPEKTGYAVLGSHMSHGENRRKGNWREIESTFFVQMLRRNARNPVD